MLQLILEGNSWKLEVCPLEVITNAITKVLQQVKAAVSKANAYGTLIVALYFVSYFISSIIQLWDHFGHIYHCIFGNYS